MSSSLFLPNHVCRGEGEAHSSPVLLPRAFSSLISPVPWSHSLLGYRSLAYEKSTPPYPPSLNKSWELI